MAIRKTEDDYIDELNSLIEEVAGLAYVAQGFDVNNEEWREKRDDAIDSLIAVAQRLKASHPTTDNNPLQDSQETN